MKILKETEDIVQEILPRETQISKVELEGPEVAIYTKNPKAFFENENYVAKLAHELKKRVNIRTSKNMLMDEEEAKKKINEIVPEDAGIQDMMFDHSFSEVVMEVMKPGLVIGKGGETSKEIILQTGWTPNILRAPTSKSDILTGIRRHLFNNSSERKKILKEVAENIYREVPENSKGWVRLTALGGFRQVGRSCIMLETTNTKILMDCGINVAATDEPFPYLDSLNFPMNELDAVIVGHAHLDHSGFIPYLFKLGYKGPVYSTLPTRDLMTLLQFDYIDVLVKEGKEPPYSEKDVKDMITHSIPRDYREVTDIAPDLRMTLHNAAHILGSASVHMHIGEGDHNLVYTGDIKYGFTRLFNNVDIKYPRLETLIIESTYGGKNDVQPNRQMSEDQLLRIINETIQRDGSLLIPVFAVGRGQEIMLVIENFYRKGLIEAKCYVDGMTREASAIHTAYPEYLRKNVQRRILQNDSPFTSEIFETADYTNRDQILENGSAIIMASSGMLTGGASLEYLYKMAENPANALVFVGWQGEGSLGRKIQNGNKEIPITTEKGRTRALNINMKVETVEGFSGHSDIRQLTSYVTHLKPKPKRILINHGDKHNCMSLSKYFSNKFRVNASSLQNLDAVRLK